MPTAKIVTEVQTFVARVREGLGVAPVIYTSSFFWDTVFNESTAYSADPLWITEYGVSTPTVPADNWGGDGWTLWQTSATGIVPGITTAVDIDQLNGTHLDHR